MEWLSDFSEDLLPTLQGIFHVESRSSLDAPRWEIRGPRVPSGRYAGEKAIGPAQIMPGNIRDWSRRALGVERSPEYFINGLRTGDPAVKRDYMRIVNDQLRQHREEGMSPVESAITWHSGRGGLRRYRNGEASPHDLVGDLPTFGEGRSYASIFQQGYGSADVGISGGSGAPARAGLTYGADVPPMQAGLSASRATGPGLPPADPMAPPAPPAPPQVPLYRRLQRGDDGQFDVPEGMVNVLGSGHALNQAGLGSALYTVGSALRGL